MKKKADVDSFDDKKDSYIDELFHYFDDSDPAVSPFGPIGEEKTPVPGSPIDKNDIVKMVQDMQSSRENYYKDTDLYPENSEENPFVPEHKEDSEGEEEEDVYDSGLIDELRMKMLREDEERESLQKELKETSEHIREIYPYLSDSFIMGVCSMKDAIANEYLTVKKVVVLHRLSFKEVENLRQFVEITLKHEYQINADEKKLIVDAFKECENADDKIIASIFDIANQAALLNGEYEGYRIIPEE